jgi:hypothetical protein
MSDRGLGLSPSPTPRRMNSYANSKQFITVLHIRTIVWRIGREGHVKTLSTDRGSVFDSGRLNELLNNPIIKSKGCHVAAPEWATWHQTIGHLTATCPNQIRPQSANHKPPRVQILFVQLPTNITVPRHHLTSQRHVSTVRPCHVAVRPAQSASKFSLFGSTNRRR